MRGLETMVAVALTSALALATTSAHADPDAARVARAERRFHEGEELSESKRYAEACAAFLESQRLEPRLGTLLNVAYCHEQEGKTATAWSEYNTAAAWALQQGRSDREKFAYDRATELAKHLPRVLLELPAGQGVGVEVDGHPHTGARLTSMMYLDPGDHTIRVTAPNKTPFVANVHVPAGASTQTVTVPSLVDDAPMAPASAPSAGAGVVGDTGRAIDTRRTLSFVVGGIGVVGVGLGTYFGVRALDEKSAASRHCAGKECDAEGVSLLDDAHSSALISTVALGAGVACFGAGLYLLLTSSAQRDVATPAPATGARLRPMAGVRAYGMMLEGAW